MKGFTLVELLIVIGIISVLTSFAALNFLGGQRGASQAALTSSLIADVRAQQTKAMSGTLGVDGEVGDYGVRFDQDSYTLFEGSTYLVGEPSNFTVQLDPNLQFSFVAFLNSEIVFERGSGEMAGYTLGANSVTITETGSGRTETLNFNRYGIPI